MSPKTKPKRLETTGFLLYYPAECPDCKADLTVPDSVAMCFTDGSSCDQYWTCLESDGLLCDVCDFAWHGYVSGALCIACDDELEETKKIVVTLREVSRKVERL